jgi:uncharacterized protein YbjQ (UPF0145 family)
MRAVLIGLILTSAIVTPVEARRTPVTVTLQSVLDMAEAKAKLDGSVKFYLAGAITPSPRRTFTLEVSDNTTSTFQRTPEEACRRNVLSALIRLEGLAKRVGANAVIDIASFNAPATFRSATDIQCLNGAFMGSLVLKGTLVQVDAAEALPQAGAQGTAP